MRAVRLGRDRAAAATSGAVPTERDLDVDAPGELEDRERVAPDVLESIDVAGHAGDRRASSASGEPHAYSSASASSMPVSQSMSRDTRSATP